jgi:hypothetical protein
MVEGIYVDPAIHWWRGKQWCHLFGDDLSALHAFAAKLGLKREWFQNDWRLPHYDISDRKRVHAVKLGAKEVGIRFTYERIQLNVKATQSERTSQAAGLGPAKKMVVLGLRRTPKVRSVTRPIVHHQDETGAERRNDSRRRPAQEGRILSKGRNRRDTKDPKAV